MSIDRPLFDRYRAIFDPEYHGSSGFHKQKGAALGLLDPNLDSDTDREHTLDRARMTMMGESVENPLWDENRFRGFEEGSAKYAETVADPTFDSNPVPEKQWTKNLKEGDPAFAAKYASMYADAPALSNRNGGLDMLRELKALMPALPTEPPSLLQPVARRDYSQPQAGMTAPQAPQMPTMNFLQQAPMQAPGMDLGQIVSMLMAMGKNTGGNR